MHSKKSGNNIQVKVNFRFVYFILLGINILVFLFFLIYWIVNVNLMMDRIEFIKNAFHWSDFFPKSSFFDFFRGLSKDFSTITPLLGMWFFFCISSGLYRIIFKSKNIPKSKQNTFPFTENYKVIWVQLGLLGTLWAFILIGFQMKEGQTSESINLMIMAFGTALLSTFAAVFLAFVFAPIVIIFSRRFIDISIEEPEELPWNKVVVHALDDVNSKLVNFKIKIEDAANAIEDITKFLNKLYLEVSHTNFQSIREIPERIKSIDKNMETLNSSQQVWIQRQNENLNGIITSISTEGTSIRNQANDHNKTILNKFENIKNIEKIIKDYLNAEEDKKEGFLNKLEEILQNIFGKYVEKQNLLLNDIKVLETNIKAQEKEKNVLITDIKQKLVDNISNQKNIQEFLENKIYNDMGKNRKDQKDAFENHKKEIRESIDKVGTNIYKILNRKYKTKEIEIDSKNPKKTTWKTLKMIFSKNKKF